MWITKDDCKEGNHAQSHGVAAFEYLYSHVQYTEGQHTSIDDRQVILPTAPGVSNEGGSSPLLALLPAVSWPWVLAWGSLEPPRRGGENAQKTGESGGEMAEIWPKTCEQGKDRRDQLGEEMGLVFVVDV